MADLASVQALYEAYIETAENRIRKRKFGEGILGLKGGPADDPCHDRFAADLEALLGEYAGEEHGSAETAEVLSYIYGAPLEHREPAMVYWMLMAVHGLTLPLTEQLDPADAGTLYRRYEGDYPRRERMPVQVRTLKALKARSA